MDFKDTFFIVATDINTGNRIPHLHVIISDPNSTNDNLVLCINFTSNNNDTSCIVNAGEHPFIQHTSYINYQLAFEENIDNINTKINDINNPDFYQNSISIPISEQLYKKIKQGALQTKKMPMRYKKYFK